MKRIIAYVFICLFFFAAIGNAQQNQCNYSLQPISASDEAALKSLPELTLPDAYKNKILPAVVDNSQQPYFRPVFNQADYCCGQAASVAYMYTYEVDRIRNLPANITQNQYPTHFAWNWINDGFGYTGGSYMHTFQLLKELGTPNVFDYGGTLSYGGPERWLSGYDKYYNGMHNRLNNAYQIIANTEEGLLTLKNWINDHLDSSSVGGVATFYAQHMSAIETLPAGTPEEGKYVLSYFGGSANHAMTIVGYHDSIRYDYNGDGQYTNDIDITNDGVVDMKDCEIGGLKMAQSYGGVPAWGDNGFAYMMYKTLADDLGNGGIWNHAVHTMEVKEDCNPQLTMKITLKHNKRECIKITAGLSENMNATEPDITKEFHVFNYQGGPMYMQGGWSVEEYKTIEFGLDITDILTHVEPGQDIRYFLQIDEQDPSNDGSGMMKNFSIIDYTSGTNEIPCSQTNVALVENGVTTFFIDANINFDKVEITNNTLPAGPVGQYYSHQMTAAGGDPPYRWYLHKEYDEQISSATFPVINQHILDPSNNNDGMVTQSLDFTFPFYDSTYNSVCLHVDGYIMFDAQLYPYPYFGEDEVLFSITRNISPFMAHELKIFESQYDGIWYEGDETYATFRWKAHHEDYISEEVNFAVTLYPDGKIEFFYGTNTMNNDLYFISGISDGNDEHYQYTSHYNQGLPAQNSKASLTKYNYPEEISLSEEGLLNGTPLNVYNGIDLIFRVVDNNFISNYKSLQFSSSGIIVLDSLSAGGDENLDYGDTALISIEVINIEEQGVQNANITISTSDEYVVLHDSTEYLGNLPLGVSVFFDDAFKFSVPGTIPDQHVVVLDVIIEGDKQQWTNTFIYNAHAPDLQIADIYVLDGENGILDPGDTCDLLLVVENEGASTAYNILAELNCSDQYITLSDTLDTIDVSNPQAFDSLYYHTIVSQQAQINSQVEFELLMNADLSYSASDSFDMQIGKTIEDFESGTLSFFHWGFDGDKDWQISDYEPCENIFCASSGNITHSMESALILDVEVLQEGEISFYKKTDCENSQSNNADYLAFFIDDVEQQRWDGFTDWSQHSFVLETGYHRLKWLYKKDADVSEGKDKAWLDLIELPPSTDYIPYIYYSVDNLNITMLPDDVRTDTIILNNITPGSIDHNMLVSYNPGNMDDGSRSVMGAFMIQDIESFYTMSNYDMELVVYNPSDDSEWIKDINLSFPQDAGLISATDFTGGSGGDLVYDGSSGYGVTANWHGEDGSGWGVLKGEETATASISFVSLQSLTENLNLDYEIFGDVYGNEPHYISGEIELINLGANEGWISLNDSSGTLAGNSADTLFLTTNTSGMADGNYQSEIIVMEQFQQRKIISIDLTVDHAMNVPRIDNNNNLKVFPNPFRRYTSVCYNTQEKSSIKICVYNIRGEKIRTIYNGNIQAGETSWIWDGKNDNGSSCKAGIYLLEAAFPKKLITRKILKLP